MRDPGIVEQRTMRHEPETFIEPHGLDLSVQPDDRVPTGGGLDQERAQQCRPDPSATPWAKHRHPTDVTVRQESRRPDRQSVARFGQGMDAAGIIVVPLERLGHVLLLDEDGTTDGRQSLGAGSPGHETDIESDGRMHGTRV